MNNLHINSMEHQTLKDRLLGKDNIFKAIYALDSYVFERGLLSKEDIQLLYQLRDSHNTDLIERTIYRCNEKLNSLLSHREELFGIKVFFRFKSMEEDGIIKFRPLHTTSLENLVCMIALLRPLMFDEQGHKISLSGICKLIPHNFYGNLPSTQTESLFVPWKQQYKRYSENLLQRYRILTETKEYTQEVCLDLKDFFPSVSPFWVYQFIFDKLKSVWTDANDVDCLKQILCKLLFFKIENKDLDVWKSVYYPNMDMDKQETYYNRGIAQGLPQSYFFGNLVMTEIAKFNDRHFPGDSYYYVDDSVIYTNGLDNEKFAKKIADINSELSNRFIIEGNRIKEIKKLLTEDAALFQQNLKSGYVVQLHPNGKSFYSNIQEKDGTHGGILPMMAKEVSVAGNLFDNMDEYDDQMSLSKINALLELIDDNLNKYKKYIDDVNKQSQAKMLKRYRKFFLFRKKLILLKNDDEEANDTQELTNLTKLLGDKELKNQLLRDFNQEVFMAEILLRLNNCSQDAANKLIKQVEEFENELAPNDRCANLYFQTSLKATEWIQKYRKLYDSYDTLNYAMRHVSVQMIPESRQFKTLLDVFSTEDVIKSIYKVPEYATNVCACSDEFKRKILNSYLSVMFGVELNDTFNFFKRNRFHTLHYFEVRTLAFVRNKNFRMTDFSAFMQLLCRNNEQPSSYIGIDANLLSILGIFVNKVRNPRHVDSLICTHQLVSGLWMNGSKFMHQYTLHNQDHAITLIRQSLKLVKHIDYLGLKQYDFFVLFLACYLHDISMVINPQLKTFNKTPSDSDIILTQCISDLYELFHSKQKEDLSLWKDFLVNIFGRVYDYFENAQRKTHAEDSALFLINHDKNFFSYIEPAILQLVANIGASHGYDTIEVYGRKSKAKDELFSVKCMMILIRLADVMDITNERVNYYLLKENFQHFSLESKFHWISHHITKGITILSEYQNIEKNNIQETIRVIMELNTNNLIPMDSRMGKPRCKGCNLKIQQKGSGKLMAYGIKETKEEVCTYETNCPLLCVWIRRKHEYLFNELIELKRYINQVNLPLFTTNIELIVKLSENDQLDSEFFDAILERLEN